MLQSHAADGVLTLTLDRPEARNALSLALLAALETALTGAEADPQVRVVVIAGAGPAFCAGHDLREVRASDRAEHVALFDACSRLMLQITRQRQPVIARVHGVATAAGCQLVATCDLAIAARTARFATPGVSIGLFCSTPMVALTRAVGRKAAMGMLLTGDLIDAAEAQRIGLVNRVVPDADLVAETAALAAAIAARSSHTVAIGKAAFHHQADLPLAEAYTYASGVMVRNMEAADAIEGIDAFLGRRAPVWRDS